MFLACAAKSNAVYVAFGEAMEDAKTLGSLEVPLHLRNAPTRLMKELGYGKDYRYAHDEPDAYAAGETYFPEGMPPREYYRPVPRGLEIKIAEALARQKNGWRKHETASRTAMHLLHARSQAAPFRSRRASPPTSRVAASRSTSRS